MKPYFALFILALQVYFGAASAQDRPKPADEILRDALQMASKENKNVLIIFHASWCGWCRKMDSSLNDRSCKKFFDDHFVIRHLVVSESRDKKNLENPGGDALRAKYRGDEQGIPFWLIFDKDGKLLADSDVRPPGTGLDTAGENVGCPATEKEVAYFIDVLKRVTPITEQEQSAIQKRFRQNED